jgi:NodT family efflux transporter outer membrane factor (OMF) lipoprotein
VWALTTLLAAMSAGCARLGPDYLRPEAPVAPQWSDAGHPALKSEAPTDPTWWQAFDDPILDRLIDTAYRQNLTLRIAGVRVLEARARLGVAVGGRYPQLQQARAGATYVSASENLANTAAAATPLADLSFWNFDAGFDAAWELDLWGKFARGIESADAALLASVATYDDVLVTLLSEVATAYVLIRTFEERLEIARRNVDIQTRSLKIADVRFRNAITTELDVQQAKALLKNTEASIPRLHTGLRRVQNALSILIGQPPGTVNAMLAGDAAIPSAPSAVAVGIPAELLRRRPDIRRAELQAAAQSALVGVAEADLYPNLTLFGSIGLVAAEGTSSTVNGNVGIGDLFDIDSVQFIGGPAVTWNIFNYGRTKNRVRTQDARLQGLLVNYQNTVLAAAREFEDATVGFVRAKQEVELLSESVAAADRSVELALVQYRDGVASYTRVLNSQSFLVLQQDLLTATRGRVARNLIAMYKALGGGWQLRQGNSFVPAETTDQMRERTDWGELLQPGAADVPPPAEAAEKLRSPDW